MPFSGNTYVLPFNFGSGTPPNSNTFPLQLEADLTDVGSALTTLKTTGGGLIPAQSDLTFYVATTGSDSNPGTLAQPFLTCLRALIEAQKYDWQSTWAPTIQFADGTYASEGVVPIVDLTNAASGIELLGNLSSPGNVVISDSFEVIAPSTSVGIGGFKFVINGTSCVNPVVGSVFMAGDLIFAGTATPFYLEGPSQLIISGNITVTATALQWFLFIAPGVVWMTNGTNIALPVALTVSESFINVVGFLDQTRSSVAELRMATIGWTHFAGVTGTKLTASQGAFLKLQDGDPATDVPGSTASVIDGTVTIGDFSTKLGTVFRSKSGFPATTDLPPGTWQIFKETGGGGVYVAANDAGVIKTTAVGNPINTQTGTPYTLALTDTNAIVEMNLAGANTVTVPLNASIPFAIGTAVRVVQIGAGATTVAAAGGVTGHNFGALGAQWKSAIVYKRGTDEWVMTSVA